MEELQVLMSNLQKVQGYLQDGSFMRNVLEPSQQAIYELQIEQLFEGKASSGEDIRPYYSEDLKSVGGYFRTPDSAKRYADWKQGIGQNAKRNPDAPNLYINGKFHSELQVLLGADSIGIYPTTPYSEMIVQKYGLETFGLTDENWEFLINNTLRDGAISWLRLLI